LVVAPKPSFTFFATVKRRQIAQEMSVVPAQTGTQFLQSHCWIPAFAGMTIRVAYSGHRLPYSERIQPTRFLICASSLVSMIL
jgi:hypothetical protein